MTKIEVVYEGDLHTQATHGPSGATLTTDAPPDNQGKGEGFSPTDLFATSLGACMMTLMGIYARRHQIALEGARITVEKHMANQPSRRVGKLVVDVQMPSGIPEAQRAPLERAAMTCPVHKSVHPEIEIPVTFRYAQSP